MHTCTAKNWMQYCANHVQLLRQCFCPKVASEAISEHLKFLGEHAPDLPSLACLCIYPYTFDTHVTPLLKALAAGLLSSASSIRPAIGFSVRSAFSVSEHIIIDKSNSAPDCCLWINLRMKHKRIRHGESCWKTRYRSWLHCCSRNTAISKCGYDFSHLVLK